ncbi:Transketolase, C-terminal section (EC [Olavius algarvensis associated proteobacterium Delta 3]|nr:Transketolase, C-terminal section (EC [Olavius algarvensis associated proteobacterium Delta 3]
MNNISQRDAFWGRVFELAKENKDVLLVIADMGAPALDTFRVELNAQYIDVGIAEQQALAVAAGLAMEGKKVFAYAIAPFISLRCYEHIRVNLASMNVPVTLVGVGAGTSYDDSGPTHHAVDDVSALRILPNLRIHNITDSVMARAFADICCDIEYPNYLRMDRKWLPDIYEDGFDFSAGMSTLLPGKDAMIVATGNMVHRAMEVAETLRGNGADIGVADVFTFPIPQKALLEAIQDAGRIITLEEHNLAGGLGSAVCEIMADHGMLKPVKRVGMDFSRKYCYRYGGREHIQSLYGLDKESLLRTAEELLN